MTAPTVILTPRGTVVIRLEDTREVLHEGRESETSYARRLGIGVAHEQLRRAAIDGILHPPPRSR